MNARNFTTEKGSRKSPRQFRFYDPACVFVQKQIIATGARRRFIASRNRRKKVDFRIILIAYMYFPINQRNVALYLKKRIL